MKKAQKLSKKETTYKENSPCLTSLKNRLETLQGQRDKGIDLIKQTIKGKPFSSVNEDFMVGIITSQCDGLKRIQPVISELRRIISELEED